MDALHDLLGIITSADESDRDIFVPGDVAVTRRGQSKRVFITSNSAFADRHSCDHHASEERIR